MRRILFIVEQCNPEWASVPLVAFNLWDALSQRADVHLVTHERNKDALEKVRNRNGQNRHIDYIGESTLLKRYFAFVSGMTTRGGTNWPLFHALSYPVYASFNSRVYAAFSQAVRQGKYDVVHAFTPVLPRYPVAMVRACETTPFVLGPVNGGLPFPPAFGEVRRKESGLFNFLRSFTRLIPGYAQTYNKAASVLAGSRYTREMLEHRFTGLAPRMALFHENGLAQDFFRPHQTTSQVFTLLFTGRLVPYKGADMLLDALARSGLDAFRLIIVGDGPERPNLEKQAATLGLTDKVHFTGWVPQKETAPYYAQADLFAFPSVREFGGAVVLEAMAAGLPCVVVDHGGISEYVDESCGIRIAPESREHVVNGFAEAIRHLAQDRDHRETLAHGAVIRAESYRWESKADWLIAHYEQLLGSTHPKEHP
ncbi:glycosyltransferase family 4 protein [Desulfovibrio subterraneus]|uniref:Glycosyl transferase family 1 domain-containing protein n=1 Tax=Desulfovibrio subterraneus TaxID=2718620 RepID=A0A7J0BMQ3_9BACT|nr:glycosyltransferase family 4 protein [Desulfovibrio subterraneus]GFM34472.1 hypothetical protein DSM101010T_28370 [Desulfovibrio subterraneus]